MEKGSFTGRFVDTETSDEVELLGLLAESDETEKIILHIHGMQGNFFQNNFVQEMLTEYPRKGISFLTVEQRGAEESIRDIEAWVEFARNLGYDKIYLQGHSLGCSKIAYYLSETREDLEGVVFISPADMHGILLENIEDGEKLLKEAREMKEENKGDEILVEQHDGWKYLSAHTFVNLYAEDSNAAVFNYRKPEIGFQTVKNIDIPIMAFVGSEDNGIVTDPEKSMKMLREKSENSPRVKTKVLDGAEHDFRGFEKEIIEEVEKKVL